MPGFYVADFTSVVPMGAQSPAASAAKPADQAFGKALHRATRPEPEVTRQRRTEAAPRQAPRQATREQPPGSGPQTYPDTNQPKLETNSETQPRSHLTATEEAKTPRSEVSTIDLSDEEPEASAAEAMAPFYMAALFDESASYLQPSAQSERIAAAERVQEFVADWLSNQTEEITPLNTTRLVAEPQTERAEVVSMALDILSQYVEETLGQTTGPRNNTPQESSVAETVSDQQAQTGETHINQRNTAELRQLMAVMMQSGRIPEPFNQPPGNQALQQQLDRILPLVISASSAAAQAATERAPRAERINLAPPVDNPLRMEAQAVQGANRQSARTVENSRQAPLSFDISDENPAFTPRPLSGSLTDTKTGLQESQMAKIFAAASAHPQSEQKGTEPSFAVPSAGSSEESTAAGQLEISEIAFAAPQQERAEAAMHMVVNGPRAIQAAGLNDVAAVKIMQLPTGQQLPETQLVDQVVRHLAAGNNGETSRMLLRLNPAELGTLRIELTMEGDKLRAQLHAQTQQVQEVLDRHLPQLRDALQMQGLKIDSFRVDVQGGHSQARDQASQWQQPQQQGHQEHRPAVTDWPPPELDIPLQQILQQPAGSISLRV